MTAPRDPQGWPLFFRLDDGAPIAFKALARRLRDHIEHGLPVADADLDQAAADPSALAFVCIRIGVLPGVKARQPLWGKYIEDWPAVFARAHASPARSSPGKRDC